MALFYSAVFVYTFAALGNLGLITRERTLLLPFLFVVLAFPMARPGEDPYPWQRRRQRAGAGSVPSGTRGPGDADEPVEATTMVASTVAEWAAEERSYTDQSGWSAADWHASS